MPEGVIVISIVFGVTVLLIFAVAIAIAVKKTKEQADRKREMDERLSSDLETDGNGRTVHQRDYLNKLRVAQSEKRIREAEHKQAIRKSTEHAHSGQAEHYEPIVGSLGEVGDEGCDELDGVRLVEHDESYCDDPAHFDAADYEGITQAIVLGEAVNNPRFKNPFKRHI